MKECECYDEWLFCWKMLINEGICMLHSLEGLNLFKMTNGKRKKVRNSNM